MASDVLVTTDWVAEQPDDKVKLIEVDVDTTAYDEGHAPGAVGFNWTSQLQDQMRRDIITKEGLEELLSEAGVSNDDTIVLYGDNNNWFAAYAFWVLEMYGHKNLKLMDGGRKKWLDENRPTTKDVPSPGAAAATRRSDAEHRRCAPSATRCSQALGNANERPGRRPLARRVQRRDHGPSRTAGDGAAHGPHPRRRQRARGRRPCKEDGTFKSAEDLEALYGGKGVTPDKDVIAYCRIGERSSHTWFALKHLLGYPNVRNYDGSWTEYGSLIDVPIEK